jgi:hypothetical protein
VALPTDEIPEFSHRRFKISEHISPLISFPEISIRVPHKKLARDMEGMKLYFDPNIDSITLEWQISGYK